MVILCIRSFRRSALRLTCHIASRHITTWAQPSVIIVGVCCGEWSNKASSVKVYNMMCLVKVDIFVFVYFVYVYICNTSNCLCLDCSMNVHHKCQTKVANLCGINQKLLAEALNQVSLVCDLTSDSPGITIHITDVSRHLDQHLHSKKSTLVYMFYTEIIHKAPRSLFVRNRNLSSHRQKHSRGP